MPYDDASGQVVLLNPSRKNDHVLSQLLSEDEERIRCLAFQAMQLPNTLSKSEIAQLGVALLTCFPRNVG